MGKYALLLTGGINRNKNMPRYKNDLEWVYKVLVNDCDYVKENIKLFYAEGDNLSYGDEAVITTKADRAEIIRYLKDMANTLNAEDAFTLVVSNHGDDAVGGCICLWGDEILEFDLLVQLLNQIKAQKYIILGECYGGNIFNWSIDNACIITANEKGEPSYTNPLDMSYDELIRHFFSYIHKEYPNGEAIPCGGNDVRKAYQYACERDAFNPQSELSRKYNIVEIPQMKCAFEGKLAL